MVLCISGGFIGGVVFIGGCGGDQKWEEDKQCLSWLQPQKHALDYNALRGSDAGTTSTTTSASSIMLSCVVVLYNLYSCGSAEAGLLVENLRVSQQSPPSVLLLLMPATPFGARLSASFESKIVQNSHGEKHTGKGAFLFGDWL